MKSINKRKSPIIQKYSIRTTEYRPMSAAPNKIDPKIMKKGVHIIAVIALLRSKELKHAAE
jgi:hypothetical protein